MEGTKPMPEQLGQEVAQKPLDEKWYGRFLECTSYSVEDAYKVEGDNLREQREQFMDGRVLNPTFVYSGLDRERIDSDEARLLDLKRQVLEEENNPTVKQAYRWRINERIAELRMFRATLDGDMHRFSRYNDFIYGKPSLETYSLTVSEIRKRLEKIFKQEPKLDSAKKIGIEEEARKALEEVGWQEYSNEVVRTAEELDGLLPLPEKSTEFPTRPSRETVRTVQEIVDRELEGLGLTKEDREHGAVLLVGGIELSADDPKTPYSSAWIKTLFETALKNLGAFDWEVVLRDDITAINVSQGKMVVEVPDGKMMGSEDVLKKLSHEVLRHVGRRVHGEKSRLSLLGLGLDRYIKGEEGVTKVTEHAVGGKFKTFGAPEVPLGIALAEGIDGEPRDFREVFNILEKIFILKQVGSKPYKEFFLDEAREKAWRHCVRIFRGTDCKTPGAALSKDLVYREGSIAVWGVVNRDTDEVYKFSIGKYDPANSRHIWILSQLGILDSDLEELEK